MRGLTKTVRLLGLALSVASLGLFAGSLTHRLPATLIGLAPLLQFVGLALLTKSGSERAFSWLSISFGVSAVTAAAIIVWAFQNMVSPAREGMIALGMAILFGAILALTWRLQKRARSAQ